MPAYMKGRVLRFLRVTAPNADVVSLSPLSEGMNMGIWIGFKHVNYLIEHAISIFLRRSGAEILGLYWDDGLSFRFLSSRVRYLAALIFDESVNVCIVPTADNEGILVFEVHAVCERFGSLVRLARGTFRAGLFDHEGRRVRRLPKRLLAAVGPGLDPEAGSPAGNGGDAGSVYPSGEAPQEGKEMPEMAHPEKATQKELRERLGIEDQRVFVWARQVAYFHCGYFRWAQHSAYLRLLEEVVDRFLHYIGFSIGKLLRARRWIPVVQEHAVDVIENVEMDETIYTTFRVTEVVANRLFRAKVSWFVIRQGRVVEVASGAIAHGYAEVQSPEWKSRLVRFDTGTLSCFGTWAGEGVSSPSTTEASATGARSS